MILKDLNRVKYANGNNIMFQFIHSDVVLNLKVFFVEAKQFFNRMFMLTDWC